MHSCTFSEFTRLKIQNAHFGVLGSCLAIVTVSNITGASLVRVVVDVHWRKLNNWSSRRSRSNWNRRSSSKTS